MVAVGGVTMLLVIGVVLLGTLVLVGFLLNGRKEGR